MLPTPEPADSSAKSVWQCVRCGHIWTPKTSKKPRHCPKCGQTNFEVPSQGMGRRVPGLPLGRPPKDSSPRAGTIKLPATYPRNRNQQSFVRILTAVSPGAWNGSGFSGSLHKAGAQVVAEVVRAHPVALECAGRSPEDKRYWLWVLWRWDAEAKKFFEIARATALDWTWAVILRDPAIRALEPRREAVDQRDRAGACLEEVLQTLDGALSRELPTVRTLVLSALYDRLSGQLARG